MKGNTAVNIKAILIRGLAFSLMVTGLCAQENGDAGQFSPALAVKADHPLLGEVEVVQPVVVQCHCQRGHHVCCLPELSPGRGIDGDDRQLHD